MADAERVVDIEERIRERYRNVELAAREGTILIGHDGRIIDVSKAEARIGVERDELIGGHPLPSGWRMFDDVGQEVPPDEHPGIRTIGGTEPVTQILTYESPSGERQRLRFVAYPLLDDPRIAVDLVVTDEQRRNETRQLLETQESRFRTMTEMLPVAVWESTASGEITYVNPKFTELSGLTAQTAPDLPMLEIVHPDDLVDVMNATNRALEENHFHSQYRLCHVDGSSRWVTSRMSILVDEDGKMTGFAGAIEDIDDLRRSERESTRLADIVEAAGDAIGIFENGTFTYFNGSAQRLLDRTDPGFVTDRSTHVFGPQFAERFASEIEEPLVSTGSWTGELRLIGVDGAPVDLSLVLNAEVDGSAVTRCVVIARDIKEQKRREDQLTHEALHDPLTGLFNRQGLDEAISELDPSTAIDLCFVDLDHFKQINDCSGHSVGDAVLVEVAARLGRVAGPLSTVARVGGDEIVVVTASSDRDDIAAQLVASVGSSAVAAAGDTHRVTVTAGVAAGRAGDFAALYAAADGALYRAKASGRNGWARAT